MRTSTARAVAAAAAAAAVIAIAAGCSDDKDSGSSTSSATSATGSASTTNPGGSTGTGAPTTSPGAGSPSTVAGPNGEQVTIDDAAILAAYSAKGGATGYLGKPLGPIVGLRRGGKFITFEHGSIYLNPASGKAFVVHGVIGDDWGTKGHEKGELGYPTSDETPGDGTISQTYDGGTLVMKDGKVTQR